MTGSDKLSEIEICHEHVHTHIYQLKQCSYVVLEQSASQLLPSVTTDADCVGVVSDVLLALDDTVGPLNPLKKTTITVMLSPEPSARENSAMALATVCLEPPGLASIGANRPGTSRTVQNF